MKRTRIVLLALLALAAAGVVWIARVNRVPPRLPRDDVHAEAVVPDACLTCHGPDGPRPRSRSHPPARDCARCHAR